MILFLIIAIVAFVSGAICEWYAPLPRARRSYRGRKSKGFIGSLMSEKRGGVFCGPGGVGHRGGRRR
jgi:hypothetical protein